MPSTLNTHCAVDLDPRFKRTQFVIEATAYEQQLLWEQHRYRLKWREQSGGALVIVGWLDSYPICFSAHWVALGTDQQLVLFWHATSKLVDYDLIDAWFGTYCTPPVWDHDRPAFVNAQEFHLCLQALGIPGIPAVSTDAATSSE